MDELDLLTLDRDLARAAFAWRGWRRQLRRGAGYEDDPLLFARELTAKTLFEALTEMSGRDPLAGPFRRWVWRLSDERVNRAVVVEAARLWREERHAIDQPDAGHFTLAELLARALAEPGKRAGFLAVFTERTAAHSRVRGMWWERRQELAERASLPSPDSLELPNPNVARIASEWLARTRDAAENELPRGDLALLIDAALAGEAREGWPGHLTPRVVRGLLDELGLFARFELDPGPLPAAIAPASFLRAFSRVGAAWVDAAAPARQPFAIAHDPFGLRRRSMGALLGIVVTSEAFLRRKLELGRARAAAHRRSLARTLLIESRSLAMRVLLRGAALRGSTALGEAFQEQLERALFVELPLAAAGSIWQLNPDDPQRFAGLLSAFGRSVRFREEHDEDWFRNPRAAEELHAEAELSPATTMDTAELEGAARTAESELLAAVS